METPSTLPETFKLRFIAMNEYSKIEVSKCNGSKCVLDLSLKVFSPLELYFIIC